MRGLYLFLEKINESPGITKKVIGQTNALVHNGCEMDLAFIKDDNFGQKLMIKDEIIVNYKKGVQNKYARYLRFNGLFRYIISQKYNFIYIRYSHFATPLFVRFLKKLSDNSVHVFLEIPTFPYDQELYKKGLSARIKFAVEKFSRKKMAKYIERIITVSDDDYIFDVPTIKISNGIDVNSIKLVDDKKKNNEQISLIAVASIALWHGFDRVIMGMAEYYKDGIKEPLVYFNIVGNGDPKIIVSLKELVGNYKLSNFVCFHDPLYNGDLDIVFEKSDIAIGSLACHRIGLKEAKTLKNREYAMRGMPIVYSYVDNDFDNQPYIMKAEPNDTPIDIKAIINFYQSQAISPQNIRNSVIDKISWNFQMKKVTQVINEICA